MKTATNNTTTTTKDTLITIAFFGFILAAASLILFNCVTLGVSDIALGS